ncbi:MAG TPA: molybdenum cofactor guanylyltransferase [Geobacteraceae bacterium]
MSGQTSTITGIILVGGKSRRMGTDKAFLRIGGVPLFERVLRAMAENFSSILLIGDRQELYQGYGLPVIADRYPGSALGGLYTGLHAAATDLVFAAPCDMPFPSRSLIRHICSMADDFDVVVPRTRQGFEPLFALYRKSCLGPMLRLLEAGKYRVFDFYPEVVVRDLKAEELDPFADEGRAFLNLNTPEEFALLKEEP